MSDIVNESLEFKENFLDKKVTSISELFIGIILITIIISVILSFVNDILILSQAEKIFIIMLFYVLYIFLWFSNRRCPKFKSDENGVLFAFNKIDKETEKILDTLYKKVISDIGSKNFQSRIKVNVLPANISILNTETAKKVREKSKAKVLIWGNAESSTINNEKKNLILDKNIFFTYEHRLGYKDGIKFFNQNISNVILRRNWNVDSSEQKIGRDHISENISDISLYLIGCSLILSPFVKDRVDGEEILAKIFKRYKAREGALNYDEKHMLGITELFLGRNFINDFIEMYFRLKDKNNKEKLSKGRDMIDRVANIGINESFYILNICILDLLEGNASLSFKHALESVKILNKSCSSFYTLAFLSYYQGNLEKGFSYLKRAIKNNNSEELSSLVGWYEDALEEDNNKIYLNFSIGQMYYNLLEEFDCNRKIAKEALSNFVSFYEKEQDSIIIKMVNESRLMLKKIDN